MKEYIYKCSICENIMNKNDRFCSNCGGMVSDSLNSSIKADVTGIGKVEFVKYLDVRETDKAELNMLNMLIKKINVPDLIIQKNSDSYTTLGYKDYDLARAYNCGYTKKIKLLLTNEDKKEYINNPIFDIQKNKKEVMWFALWDDNNIDLYANLLLNMINDIE